MLTPTCYFFTAGVTYYEFQPGDGWRYEVIVSDMPTAFGGGHPDRHALVSAVRYVDDDENITESYPFNPNGSPAGIAGLCSPDGRHLAMMPHPERVVLPWQWAWLPEDLRHTLAASPWLRMFQNAREWCERGNR